MSEEFIYVLMTMLSEGVINMLCYGGGENMEQRGIPNGEMDYTQAALPR